MKERPSQEDYTKTRLSITLGLLGISFAAIIQLLATNRAELSDFLLTSLLLLSISTPLLALDAFISLYELLLKRSMMTISRRFSRFFASVLVVTGILMWFFHFDWVIGVSFTASIITSVLFWRFSLRKINKNP